MAANLLNRQFQRSQPNEAWVTDTTYIATSEGWLYLAVMLDLFSRHVVGWAMGARNDRALVLRARHMAAQNRRPPKGLLHHSDRGSTYASSDYQIALRDYDMVWFYTLKVELVHDRKFQTRTEA